ncbi:hypothetical protein J9978_07005 [Chromobacterium violaceum]|uniref:hypothetical protein n=1 Tax=Chromobacterium violaceum TaxID=536 RepID=UPI001B345042|nr:hypothetical protein [Chromobacterium violaceum]MBP4049246.1 hypothetical protein [Chromobacterium violaceum]
MSLESSIADLVRASTDLTATVRGKTGEIDSKVAAKINEMDAWRTSVRGEFASIAYRNIWVGGSADHWYPVVFDLPARRLGDIQIARYVHEDKVIYGDGNGHMLLHLRGVSGEWGGTPAFLYPVSYGYGGTLFLAKPPVANFGLAAYGMQAVVWLLGNRTYNISQTISTPTTVYTAEKDNLIYAADNPQFNVRVDALTAVSSAMIPNNYLRGV